jgi:hypothetical protein
VPHLDAINVLDHAHKIASPCWSSSCPHHHPEVIGVHSLAADLTTDDLLETLGELSLSPFMSHPFNQDPKAQIQSLTKGVPINLDHADHF